MAYLVKVNFNNSNKHYNFSSEIEDLEIGDKVIVETIKGVEMATICSSQVPVEEYNGTIELKPILRRATGQDLLIFQSNLQKANGAAKIFVVESQKLNLDMKLLTTEYTLDSTKVIFTYAAADRVDFRELLKVLSSKLKVRIELKQIAPRDRAQLVGGLGPCGLPLCCATFLGEFDGISLNRAKNQLLSINIPKLSGQCGKLMCCLKYEDDYYTEEKKLFPELNTKIQYNNIEYKITSFNVLSKNVRLEAEENIITLTLDEVNRILYQKDVPEKDNNKKQKKNKEKNNQFSLDNPSKEEKPSNKQKNKKHKPQNKQQNNNQNNSNTNQQNQNNQNNQNKHQGNKSNNKKHFKNKQNKKQQNG
jgi:cell fate regulator YaaT (PSP1 superfamily)